MSRLGQILLFVGMVFMILWFVSVRAIGVNNLPFTWVLLSLGVVCFAVTLYKDFRFFVELSGQRTTKHGLNAGVMVLIVLALLVGVNFVGYKHVKKFDYTKEGLHSLSDQTKTILGSLKEDLVVKGFFTDKQENAQSQQRFKDLMDEYSAVSSKLKYEFINPIKKPEEAKAFNVTASGSIILLYQGRKTRIDEGTEQAFTNAIIKVSREKNKSIYYVTGHGELDFDSAEAEGGTNFKKYLAESSYDVKPLSFVEKTIVPNDAEVLIVAGPKQAYLAPEIAAIKDYVYKGGKLLLALDPGTKTNLAPLAASLGVDFKNTYILDQLGQLVGGGGATAVGYEYSHTSELTKSFPKGMTIFQLASPLKVAKDKPDAITVEAVVKSSPASFSKAEIKAGEMKFIEGKDEKGPLNIVFTAQGKMRKEGTEKQDLAKVQPKNLAKLPVKAETEPGDFSAVIVGDSDFLSNRLIDIQLNRDLALNSVSYLAKDKELLSIRPKVSEGAQLTITQTESTILSWTLVAIIPFIIFMTGSVVWYRRKTA